MALTQTRDIPELARLALQGARDYRVCAVFALEDMGANADTYLRESDERMQRAQAYYHAGDYMRAVMAASMAEGVFEHYASMGV